MSDNNRLNELSDDQLIERVKKLKERDLLLSKISAVCFFPMAKLYKAVRPVKEPRGDGMAWFVNTLFGGPALIITAGALSVGVGVAVGLAAAAAGAAPLVVGFATTVLLSSVAMTSIATGAFFTVARLPVQFALGDTGEALKKRGIEINVYKDIPAVIPKKTLLNAGASEEFNKSGAVIDQTKSDSKPENSNPNRNDTIDPPKSL